MKDRDLGQKASSRLGQSNENLPPIRSPLDPTNKMEALEFVDQTHSAMMFYLQPFAEVSDAQAGLARERLQGQKRFVLLRRQVSFFG